VGPPTNDQPVFDTRSDVRAADRLAWSHWGGDLSNRRWSQVEKKLTVAKAGKLKVKWEADVAGSTSATPTIHNGFLYVPDWEGAGAGCAGCNDWVQQGVGAGRRIRDVGCAHLICCWGSIA
jgi:hypothetical protein